MRQIDERDTMLSRIRYQKGDGMYEEYYHRHPENKDFDDMLREMPDINGIDTPMYDALKSPFADAAFAFLADIKDLSFRKAHTVPSSQISPIEMTEYIKNLSKYIGATDVGICEMKPEYYYSHQGRTASQYGKTDFFKGKYGIVFTKEMSREMINRAPHVEEMIAVTKGYMDLAIMGMWLSYYIAMLGYDAKNNMDMTYHMFTPLVAQAAGLGEIGRAGLLVTPNHGMRVRIGVITTDLPLIADTPVAYGIKTLCAICGKCAQNCPSRAIDQKTATMHEEGYFGYHTDQEKCFKMWKTLGTDCGVCLSSCPLSQDLPDDIRKGLNNDPQKIIQWDKEHIGKRMYNHESLNIYK